MRLTSDRVLIKLDASETKVGSIIIPDTAQNRSYRGTVMAHGPGVRMANGDLAPISVRVGDKVIFGKYAGTALTAVGDDQLFMRETEILGVEVDDR